MILISTRLSLISCRYLTRAYYEKRWVAAPEIAAYYNMNVRALMPALRSLTKAGILKSRVGGNTPGFMFANDPKTYSLLDVLTVLEDGYEIQCCKRVIPDLRCDCQMTGQCIIHSRTAALINRFKQQLADISIVEHAQEDTSQQYE